MLVFDLLSTTRACDRVHRAGSQLKIENAPNFLKHKISRQNFSLNSVGVGLNFKLGIIFATLKNIKLSP